MKKWLSYAGIGILCSFSVMALLLAVLPLFSSVNRVFLAFPVFRIYLGAESAQMIFARMAFLFLSYGIIGGSIYYVCKTHDVSILRQTVISWFLMYIAWFVTAWMCNRLSDSWIFLIGSILSFAFIWLLRVWRWKSRVDELDLALPAKSVDGKRRIWNTAVSQFGATALIWAIAALHGVGIVVLLCL